MAEQGADVGVEEFVVSAKGETTEETRKGVFKVKTRLSHRDRLTQDRIRRELLGGADGGPRPSDRSIVMAEVFSQLAVRVVSAPSWWTDNGNGMDLEDDSIVSEVYDKAMAPEKRRQEKIRKQAEEAQADLKKAEAKAPAAG
jgi:hypothetical protein